MQTLLTVHFACLRDTRLNWNPGFQANETLLQISDYGMKAQLTLVSVSD